MIIIKTPKEIELMREGGEILAKVLREVSLRVKPGVSTQELDSLAEELIIKSKGKPSFKGYKGYPAALCASVNNEVVHGIPSSEKILKSGDIVGLDLGLEYKGCFTDMTITVPVGKVSKIAHKLIKVTKNSLTQGIRKIEPGNFISDISRAIQDYVERQGFSVVRDLVGHGVGREVHEDPPVPNFFDPKLNPIEVKERMTLALEPMINMGSYEVEVLDDGWTVVTRDGFLSAHFEHTVAVTKEGYEILTII